MARHQPDRPDASPAAADVLANLGHELRTPLTIIQGLSEILLDDLEEGRLDPAASREFLESIHRASVSLGKLVETSIMLTKLSAGHLVPHLQSLQLLEAIERVIGQFADEARGKGLRIVLELDEALPPVRADGLCLELALQALLENAIKFNRQDGEIRWTARGEGDAVRVSIRDTGVGIPRERLNEIFSVFAQAETGTTRRFGGLGLGLPLVRRLLDSMGAEIRAESPGPDHGSTFTLIFPRSSVLS